MAGLAFDGKACRAASTLDDAIDGLVGKARELDAAATGRTEYGIVARIFDIRRRSPDSRPA